MVMVINFLGKGWRKVDNYETVKFVISERGRDRDRHTPTDRERVKNAKHETTKTRPKSDLGN